MSSPSVSDLCATIREQADRVALLVTAQATEITSLRRKVIALTDDLHAVNAGRDRLEAELEAVTAERNEMRSALARWHIAPHKGAA